MFKNFRFEISQVIFAKVAIILALSMSASYGSAVKSLTVLAEPNMVLSLTKIARVYSQKNAVIVSVGFASAANLIDDIELGEPADVFISAHPEWLFRLKQKGLIDIYNVGHIASDDLVLVTSKDNLSTPNYLLEKNINLEEALQNLDRNRLNLIIDNEESSLGKYSYLIVKALQLNDVRLSIKLAEDKSSFINLLQNNPDNYGILLSSQLHANDDLKILARKKNKRIFYQALVIAGDSMDVAREFLKFLKSPAAKDIFRENGFIVEN